MSEAKAKRFMSHRGHVIYYNAFGFMVAKGDGTDEYFTTWQQAAEWIDKKEDAKQKERATK